MRNITNTTITINKSKPIHFLNTSNQPNPDYEPSNDITIFTIPTATINVITTINKTIGNNCCTNSTAAQLQVQNDQSTLHDTTKVYSDGLVLNSLEIDHDLNRSETELTTTTNSHTYASSVQSSIDPVAQLLTLRKTTNSQKFIINNHQRYDNKWRNRQNKHQQRFHNRYRSQITNTTLHKTRTRQQIAQNNLYCPPKRQIPTKTTYNNIIDNKAIDTIKTNYYSLLSDDYLHPTDSWDETKYLQHQYIDDAPSPSIDNNTIKKKQNNTTQQHLIELDHSQITNIKNKKQSNHNFNNTQAHSSKHSPIETTTSLQNQTSFIDNYSSILNKRKKKFNTKFRQQLSVIMPRKLQKPSSVLQSLKNDFVETTNTKINKAITNTRNLRSAMRNASLLNTNSTSPSIARTNDNNNDMNHNNDTNTHDSTISINNTEINTEERWVEIKKKVTDIKFNPMCPHIFNAVPETILDKPVSAPNITITPVNTMSLMVYIKGPSHWQQQHNTKRKPIFKIRKVLLGFLYATQRVCPDSRLGNISNDPSIPDILTIDDIPENESDEKSYIFNAQVNRGTFQGQILVKTSKEFHDFIRNNDFQNWIRMETITIKLQPHTGVKYNKIGFFMEVLNSHAMDSFHTSTLQQWLVHPLPNFVLFSDTMYHTSKRTKKSCRVLYVLCAPENKDEINSHIEELSHVIPWTYYEAQYFNAFDSNLKISKIQDQKELHASATSYLINGFIDNDTILMNYTKPTTEALLHSLDDINKTTILHQSNNILSSSTEATLNAKVLTTTDKLTDESNDEKMMDSDSMLNSTTDHDSPSLPDTTLSPSDTMQKPVSEHPLDKTTPIEIPNDYVGSFMEYYYKNEYGQPLYFQVGPVVNHQREILVLQHNHLYAEKMNQIVIGDLSIHMTSDACELSLDQNVVKEQLQLYQTWKPSSIQSYIQHKNMQKSIPDINKNISSEPTNKRPRNDVNITVPTNSESSTALPLFSRSAIAIEAYADEILGTVAQATEKYLLEREPVTPYLTDNQSLTAEGIAADIMDTVAKETEKYLLARTPSHNMDSVQQTHSDSIATEWQEKIQSLEDKMNYHHSTLELMMHNISMNELKTTSRISTIYDTIETKCNDFERSVLKVSEGLSDIYERTQDANDTKFDEIRTDIVI